MGTKYVYTYISSYFFADGDIKQYLTTTRKFFEYNMRRFASKSAESFNQAQQDQSADNTNIDYIEAEFSLIMRNNMQQIERFMENPGDIDIINLGKDNILQHFICRNSVENRYAVRNYLNIGCNLSDTHMVKEQILRAKRYIKEAGFKQIRHVKERTIPQTIRIDYTPGDFELKLEPYSGD